MVMTSHVTIDYTGELKMVASWQLNTANEWYHDNIKF